MIQTEKTPNPDSIKFLSEKIISTIGNEEFHSKNKDKITISL
jgi:Scaffold protein Nfu/NifU N terminal.